ncbi:MAG: 3-oxoacyl-ACP reductase FabG [Chloroflexi bacterium]|nr:3-oxoacyl-ACP reductase FabG [Chloroflexota bacterium]
MSGKLQGRVAIVTGGSRGIGAAVCKAFGAEGARVVVNYLANAEMAADVVAEINRGPGQAITVQGDVSNRADVDRIVAAAHEAFGPVDIMVCNAAHYPRSPWYEITEEVWDRVMAVNLKGTLFCCQAVYPDMRARGKGSIINLTSVTVELGWGPFLHYVTSKAGLIGLTRSLAREVGKEGIRVNAVMPGAIRTEQEELDFPNQDEVTVAMAQRQCLAQRGLPADMTGAFVYLASDDSAFVTGQVINVDGGWVHY